jgi:hypothetical protein
VVSGDGSTVVYSAGPPLPFRRGVASDSNAYAYNVATGTTTTVGVRPDGGAPNAYLFSVAVNRNGTKVAFQSPATNLDPSDSDGDNDIYLRDLSANTTTLVSRGDGAGTPSGNDSAYLPSIDSEGRRVAFTSNASDLASGDATAVPDVFVRDVVANTTTLVSRPSGAGTPAGNNESRSGSVSGDGTKVAFETRATDLGDGGGDVDTDVYVRDLAASTTTLASRVGASGPSANGDADSPVISRDGSTVAYQTAAPNVLGFATSGQLGIVRTLADGATAIGSRGDGVPGQLPIVVDDLSLSADGGCLAFSARGVGLVPDGYPSPDWLHVYLRTLRGECPRPVPPVPGVTPNPTPIPKQVGPGPDRTAPVITAATLSPKRFAVASASARAAAGKKKKRKKVARGTTVRFRLSETASVVLTAARRERGRRSGKTCVKSTPKLVKRKAKRCTRYVAKGTVRVSGKAGANSVKFTGRISRKAIPRGSYQLKVDATDAARNKAKPKTLTFTILKG